MLSEEVGESDEDCGSGDVTSGFPNKQTFNFPNSIAKRLVSFSKQNNMFRLSTKI